MLAVGFDELGEPLQQGRIRPRHESGGSLSQQGEFVVEDGRIVDMAAVGYHDRIQLSPIDQLCFEKQVRADHERVAGEGRE